MKSEDWRTKVFPAGSFICRSGETVETVFRLRAGVAELLGPPAEDGAETVLRTVGPDEVFGVTEAISQVPFTVTLRAVSDCKCEYLDAEDFRRMLGSSGELRQRLLRRLADGLQRYLNSFKDERSFSL